MSRTSSICSECMCSIDLLWRRYHGSFEKRGGPPHGAKPLSAIAFHTSPEMRLSRCETAARNVGSSVQERLTRNLLVSTTSSSICDADILPSSMSSRRSSTPGLRQCRRDDSMDCMPADVCEQLFYVSVCLTLCVSVCLCQRLAASPRLSVCPSLCFSVSVRALVCRVHLRLRLAIAEFSLSA